MKQEHISKHLHILEKETVIPRPLEEVFDFFSKAENLNRITPADLHFRFLSPLPVKIKKGTTIDYRIRISGIPFRWRTLISEWEPPYRFTDEQIRGPYRMWIHQHTFTAVEGGTLMKDKVQFLSPGFFLEPLVNRLFVEHRVKAIFAYREKIMKEIFK